MIKYQLSIQAAWIERNISRRMTETFLLRTPFNQSRQSHKEKQYRKQQAGNIEKKESSISLIKVHNFRLNKMAINQQVKLATMPNTNTAEEGLSREGIKTEMTKEPKNKVPILIKTSANLSSWPAERMENLNLAFGIGKNYKTSFG